MEVTPESVGDAAWTIVDHRGDVEGFSQTVLALDRGYTVEQIVAHPATLNGAIPDIVVNAEQPEGEPQGVLVVPDGSDDEDDEEGALGGIRLVALAQQQLDEASQMQVEFSRMLLAELYIEAQIAASRGPAPFADDAPPEPERDPFVDVSGEASAEGAAILAAVLALSARGYSLDQVLVALAAGDVRADPGGDSCWYIPGETVAAPDEDLFAEDCTPIDELENEVDRMFPADRDDEDDDTSSSSSSSLPDVASDDVDGTYTGEFSRDIVGDGDVVQNEVRLVISDGEVTELRGSSAVEGFPSETGAGDRILCVSDGTSELSATGTAALDDGRAELPAELTLDQTMGVPLTDVECDPDLAGAVTFPLTARVTVDQGTAVVQLLAEGQILDSATLTR